MLWKLMNIQYIERHTPSLVLSIVNFSYSFKFHWSSKFSYFLVSCYLLFREKLVVCDMDLFKPMSLFGERICFVLNELFVFKKPHLTVLFCFIFWMYSCLWSRSIACIWVGNLCALCLKLSMCGFFRRLICYFQMFNYYYFWINCYMC